MALKTERRNAGLWDVLWQGFAPMAYKLDPMLRAPTIAALSLAALALCACATPSLGPPPPGYQPPPPGEPVFKASEFAWSMQAGGNAIAGRLATPKSGAHFTCQGSSVILTPDTPWSRRRMEVLYLSSDHAALPADEVRARTADAPPGDSTPFIKRTTCDAADHFSFTGLPDGSWYVITIAKPTKGGPSMALMKRVITRGGKPTPVVL